MKKIRILIVDDERSARELLKDLLADVAWVEVIGEATAVDEALVQVLLWNPDVILLDVQMPGADGFALVEALLELEARPEIIFITAFEKYAIRAIRSSAFDYLLKPVRKEDLTGSLKKLQQKVETNNTEQRFQQLLYQLSDKKKIKFNYRNGFVLIDPDEILFCRADSNYTVLELESGKKYTVSLNLGKVEEMLPDPCFRRISRSHLINLHYLARVDRKNMICELVNASAHPPLTVSRKYLRDLEDGCDRHFTMHK